MIVIIKLPFDEVYLEDVKAIVWSNGSARLCRDGKPDEYLEDDFVVVNDG